MTHRSMSMDVLEIRKARLRIEVRRTLESGGDIDDVLQGKASAAVEEAYIQLFQSLSRLADMADAPTIATMMKGLPSSGLATEYQVASEQPSDGGGPLVYAAADVGGLSLNLGRGPFAPSANWANVADWLRGEHPDMFDWTDDTSQN